MKILISADMEGALHFGVRVMSRLLTSAG